MQLLKTLLFDLNLLLKSSKVFLAFWAQEVGVTNDTCGSYGDDHLNHWAFLVISLNIFEGVKSLARTVAVFKHRLGEVYLFEVVCELVWKLL